MCYYYEVFFHVLMTVSQEFTDFMQGRRMLWILTPLLIITQVFIMGKCQWTDLLAKCWLENTRRDFESRESFISGVATGYYPVPFQNTSNLCVEKFVTFLSFSLFKILYQDWGTRVKYVHVSSEINLQRAIIL